MMGKAIVLMLVLAAPGAAVADEGLDHVDVFTGGEAGYPTYRIPAIATTARGTVLAFAEGRAARDDHARNDIVLKRSTDQGATWGPVQVVAQDGTNALNNPCVAVLPGSGRILLMFQHYPESTGGEHGALPGHTGDRICRNILITSEDDGATWSEWRDLTASTKRPEYVTSIASGPGNGIVLRRGPHSGRVVFPFNQGPFGDWAVYAVYSDDQGETWAYGDVADEGDPGMGNEVQMAELVDGSIRLNSRGCEGARLRKTAVSRDAGVTWSPLVDVPALPEPECNAAFFRFSDPLDGEKSRLLYTGPDSRNSREHGAVHLSYDEGETWSVKKRITHGRFAYSALTRLPDGRAGCLYETGGEDAYERICLARFTIAWVTDGADAEAARHPLAHTDTPGISAGRPDRRSP